MALSLAFYLSNFLGHFFHLWPSENNFLIFCQPERNCRGRTAGIACKKSTLVFFNIYRYLFLYKTTERHSSEYVPLLINHPWKIESLTKINNELLWISGIIHIANPDFTLYSVSFIFGMASNLQLSYSNSRTSKIMSSCFLVHPCSQWYQAAYLAFLYFFFNFLHNGCIQNLQVTRWARQSRHRMCLQPGNNFLHFLSSE